MKTLIGDIATAELTASRNEVLKELTYLRTEIGHVHPLISAPSTALEGTWLRTSELLENPTWLHDLIVTTGQQLGTDDPMVAASLFIQNYAYRIFAPCVAYFLTTGVCPVTTPSMTVSFARGRVSTVGYQSDLAYVVPTKVASRNANLAEPQVVSDFVTTLYHEAVTEHLAPLIASTRSVVTIGERLLWGNVIASAATAFRTMEGLRGAWVRAYGDAFLDQGPSTWSSLGSFYDVQVNQRRGWFWERTNCCLYDRLSGSVKCADCSRNPRDQRRAAYEESLRADQ